MPHSINQSNQFRSRAFRSIEHVRVRDFHSKQGEVENSEFSENSETSENQFSEVFNSEFSILHYTQNGKLGDENFGVLFQAFLTKLRVSPTPSFPFCTIPKTENSELETSEFSLRFTRTAIFFNYLIKLRGFPTPSFPFCTTLKTENSEMENLGV